MFLFVLNPTSFRPLAKFWTSQLMLIGPHKSWYFFVSIFPKNKTNNLPLIVT